MTEPRNSHDLPAASSWRLKHIKLAGGHFDADDACDSLPTEVTAQRALKDEISTSIYSSVSSLTVELDELLRRSDENTNADLEYFCDNGEENPAFTNHPLETTLNRLSDIFITLSQEAYLRHKERRKGPRAKAAEETEETADHENLNPAVAKALPVESLDASASTPQKRKVSQTSFGTRSTETTPKKSFEKEQSVQELWNAFARDVIKGVYGSSRIEIPWVENRVMKLDYHT